MAKKFVVRVVQTVTPEGVEVNEGGPINGAFLDCLRYAGLVTVHNLDQHPLNLTLSCFDIHVPNQRLVGMLAERMRSFGFNAVKAPATT